LAVHSGAWRREARDFHTDSQEKKIQAWIDDEQAVDVETTDRKIDIRFECEPSRPLGIATWRTTGAVRNVCLKAFKGKETPEPLP